MILSDLTGLECLRALTDAELEQLLELGREVFVPDRATYIEEGSRADSFAVLVRGRVAVSKGDNRLTELEAGVFLGEMGLFNDNIRVSRVDALEHLLLLEIPTDEFWRRVLHHDPLATRIIESLGQVMTERLQQQDARLFDQIDRNSPELARLAATFEPIKRQLMADWALKYHSIGRPGKLAIVPTKPSGSAADLSVAYSPGVSEPCVAIRSNPARAYEYTAKGQLVGVITNGTAVLGLGNIGALAAKPVMEGKAILFKKFADIDAFDIEVDETDPDRFIDIVVALAPTFGGINLEDIRAPECFRVEQECNRRTDIPVFHDDQHGTAIIAGAALLNALELTGRDIADVRVVFSGAGAAGFSCARYFLGLGLRRENLVMTDVKGVVYRGRGDRDYLAEIAADTEARTLAEAIAGADVFVGASAAGVLKAEMLRTMNRDPVVFAMANPVPEIDYPLARQTRADIIMGTGRSDYPNQINNVSAFPYIFRGALDCSATAINEAMKQAATATLAALAREAVTADAGFAPGTLAFGRNYIIPKPFDRRLLTRIPVAVAEAAMATGVARRLLDPDDYRQRLQTLVRIKG